MSEAFPIASTSAVEPVRLVVLEDAVTAAQTPATLSSDQIRTIDEAFTPHAEGDLSAGLLMLWASTPLLVELAKDHFHKEKQQNRDTVNQ